jgi:hypothetical protein
MRRELREQLQGRPTQGRPAERSADQSWGEHREREFQGVGGRRREAGVRRKKMPENGGAVEKNQGRAAGR